MHWLSGSLECSCCYFFSHFAKFREQHQPGTTQKERENELAEEKNALSHFSLSYEQIRSVAGWSLNNSVSVWVDVCLCVVRIRNMNQGSGEMDDNGIKLKSKLKFYFVFWLKHEFCQLLPLGCQILICMRLNQAAWYNGNNPSPYHPPTIPTSTVVTQKMDRVAGKVSKKQTDRDAKIERDGRPNEYKNACCQILNLYVMLVLLLFDTNR